MCWIPGCPNGAAGGPAGSPARLFHLDAEEAVYDFAFGHAAPGVAIAAGLGRIVFWPGANADGEQLKPIIEEFDHLARLAALAPGLG